MTSLNLISIIWFLIPAGVANMAAGISSKIWPRFDYPIDMYKTFRGKRIFGDHKTVRGLIFGTIVGFVAYLIQNSIQSNYTDIIKKGLENYQNNLLLGILLPFGALAGDAIKSFFKRQLEIKPGKSWFPFDQTDWLIGTMVISLPILRYDIFFVLKVLSLGILLHIIIKTIGFLLKLQEEIF